KKCDEEKKKKLMKELHGLIRGKMKQELVAAVIQMFKGHIRQMLRHAAASTIVEYAYNDKAVLTQKLMITDELYGPTYAICKVSTHTPSALSDELQLFPTIFSLLLLRSVVGG
ncbi:hypothetical protein XENOCAPTIV_018834, partial [Xenoophorus captivus]